MSEITQVIIAMVLSFLLDRFLKPYLLRKWLGGGGVKRRRLEQIGYVGKAGGFNQK